ncbi:hypothetical protein HPT29_018595 [Microvirga terrae]|uniref:Uncharacterized protein n=1 Tax=Microvirga terrae TaxID=2740529 RepID=A0ABY5RNX0_9HYPH|nr:hypothetical protein [Microvirga terrae]UVF18482.1 hypothetical protein HPT29_018595 [Microvirga terrae]
MSRGKFGRFENTSSLLGGFRYRPDLPSKDEERDLIVRFAKLPFEAFEFHGYRGEQRVISFA